MIGRHSIIKNFIVANTSNPRVSHEVIIQMDKNKSICDVILPNKPKKPLRPTEPKLFKQYKEEKAIYDSQMLIYKQKRSEILNVFRGRPIESQNVRIQLSNLLYEVCNETR